eukprot:Anaeramoba_ignava/a609598_44.p1 GENE.a609598_44~~a609598_44.p1  ORF type:complete len:898 (+),score=247.85 a609598_44:145-2838(+)
MLIIVMLVLFIKKDMEKIGQLAKKNKRKYTKHVPQNKTKTQTNKMKEKSDQQKNSTRTKIRQKRPISSQTSNSHLDQNKNQNLKMKSLSQEQEKEENHKIHYRQYHKQYNYLLKTPQIHLLEKISRGYQTKKINNQVVENSWLDQQAMKKIESIFTKQFLEDSKISLVIDFPIFTRNSIFIPIFFKNPKRIMKKRRRSSFHSSKKIIKKIEKINNPKPTLKQGPNQDQDKEQINMVHLESITSMYKINKNQQENVPKTIRKFERPKIYIKKGGLFPKIYDSEIQTDNPAELMNRFMRRNIFKTNQAHEASLLNVEENVFKPNYGEKRIISKILEKPLTYKFSDFERDLIKKYRFWLVKNRKPIAIFIRSVDWNEKTQQKQAEEIFKQIKDSNTMHIGDIMEFLTSNYNYYIVRKFSVEMLRHKTDEEIEPFLLQLVSSLKYEGKNLKKSKLANFLLERAMKNIKIASNLYWFCKVETENKIYGSFYSPFLSTLNEKMGKIFESQEKFFHSLCNLQKAIKNINKPRKEKIQMLNEMLIKGEFSHLNSFPESIFPLDPGYLMEGIEGKGAFIFKSTTQPLGLKLRVRERIEEEEKEKKEDESTGDSGQLIRSVFSNSVFGKNVSNSKKDEQKEIPERNYGILFKMGDDMRQDQLVVQLIQLMDLILKKENVDLNLTPYRVLPFSTQAGLIELVQNVRSLFDVLQEGTILDHLKKFPFNIDEESPNGIKREVMERYINSCAGYSVITYILGIGDRHLDNLLLVNDGRLLHIDFGFILGKDPKPFPPPFKLKKEMIDPMGGANSSDYRKFKSRCCLAFNVLRKSANLVINLLYLMKDSNIPDITNNSADCILKVIENYQLELTEEEAENYFIRLIDRAVSSFGSKWTDGVHVIEQYWRGFF